jgi:hypothetical protein
VQGWIALEQGNLKKAERFFQRSVQAAFSIQSVVFGMEAILGLTMLWMKSGASDQAARLLGFLLHDPVTPNMVKDQARGLLQSLQEQLGPELAAEALEHGKTLSLEQVNTILAQPLPTV